MPLSMPTLINTFENSVATGEGLGSSVQQRIIIESGALTVPIGALVPWCKSFTGVPTLLIQNYAQMFVECNGQVLSDPDSPLNGQTIPNLNGNSDTTKRFLRGSTTSGTTGGSATHVQSYGTFGVTGGGLTKTEGYVDANHIPPYYEVVWLMRVK